MFSRKGKVFKRIYLSWAPLWEAWDFSPLGRMTFKRIATIVARTTGDEPKIVVTHQGKALRDPEACVTPIPRATDRPTIEVFR